VQHIDHWSISRVGKHDISQSSCNDRLLPIVIGGGNICSCCLNRHSTSTNYPSCDYQTVSESIMKITNHVCQTGCGATRAILRRTRFGCIKVLLMAQTLSVADLIDLTHKARIVLVGSCGMLTFPESVVSLGRVTTALVYHYRMKMLWVYVPVDAPDRRC
jgi:hypothetical protein